MRRPASKTLCVSAAAVLLLAGTAVGIRTGYKTVTVQDGGQRRVVRGFGWTTVNDFLEHAGVAVSSRDRIRPSATAPVTDGMTVIIEHPARVTIIDGQTSKEVYTFAKTWKDVLKECGISLGPDDSVERPLDTPIASGAMIRIHRAQTETTTATQEIPFQTIRRPTSGLYIGQERVLTYGVKGLVEVQTTRVLRDGTLLRQSVARRVIRQPVNQVVEYGTSPRPQTITARDGTTLWIKKRLVVVATAYVAGGTTSTGWRAQPGVIAVDPSVIPIGTRVYIPGIGVVRAEDTGGAIVGNRIDICVATQAQAEAWGVRTITIYELQ